MSLLGRLSEPLKAAVTEWWDTQQDGSRGGHAVFSNVSLHNEKIIKLRYFQQNLICWKFNMFFFSLLTKAEIYKIEHDINLKKNILVLFQTKFICRYLYYHY